MGDEPHRTADYVEEEVTELGTPCLEIMRGLPPGKPIRLLPGSLVLGRDEGADVQMKVTGISRKHARVTTETSGEVKIVDLGSRNGTFLNGRRIETASLRDGDEIRIGQAVLQLRYLGGPGRRPSPQAASAPPPALSAREYEVAKLVAEGLTNAGIGKHLSISPATVGRHLSNVYERLGIHSRAALAKYVLTAGKP